MSSKYIVFIGLAVLIAIGCNRINSPKASPLSSSQKIEDIAKEQFGDTYQLLYSKDKSNVCIYNSRTTRKGDIYSTNKFTLYNTSKESIVFEDQLTRVSEMVWIDNTTLKVETVAGMIRDNESGRTHHLYNLSTGQKSSSKVK